MKPGQKIVKLCNNMVEEVGERAGLSRPVKRFLAQVVLGMTKSGSVRLSEIGRAGEQQHLKTVENRLSYHLNSPQWEDESLREAHLLWAASTIRISQDTVLFFDISDIAKKYARAMEYLANIYDHDEKHPAKGYWELNVEAINEKGREQRVLWEEIYSQLEPDFTGQNDRFFKAVRRVMKEGFLGWLARRGERSPS